MLRIYFLVILDNGVEKWFKNRKDHFFRQEAISPAYLGRYSLRRCRLSLFKMKQNIILPTTLYQIITQLQIKFSFLVGA